MKKIIVLISSFCCESWCVVLDKKVLLVNIKMYYNESRCWDLSSGKGQSPESWPDDVCDYKFHFLGDLCPSRLPCSPFVLPGKPLRLRVRPAWSQGWIVVLPVSHQGTVAFCLAPQTPSPQLNPTCFTSFPSPFLSKVRSKGTLWKMWVRIIEKGPVNLCP